MTSSTHHYARFIPSEEIDAQAVRHWKFGDVQQAAPGAPVSTVHELPMLRDLLPPPAPQSKAEVEPEGEDFPAEQAGYLPEHDVQVLVEQARQEAHADAYKEGFDAGQQDGLEEGQKQGREAASAEWQQKMELFQSQQGKQIAERLHSILQRAQKEVGEMHHALADDLLKLASDIARQVVRQELRCNPEALLPVVREALDMLGAESKPILVRLNPSDLEQLGTQLKAAHPQPKIEWLADASVKPGDCLVESAGAQVDGSLERRWQRAVAALGLVSTWYDGAPAHGQ